MQVKEALGYLCKTVTYILCPSVSFECISAYRRSNGLIYRFTDFMSCGSPLCHQAHSGMMSHAKLDLLSRVVCPGDYSAKIPARGVTYFTELL
jgi:hypothetical protein